MISVELALWLREAGLPWKPAAGDRFVVANRDMDAEVFVVSELTIEVRGSAFHFNGTTEWALDSIEQDDVVWLPREGQLRDALGPRFRSLEPVGDGWPPRRRTVSATSTSTRNAPTHGRCCRSPSDAR